MNFLFSVYREGSIIVFGEEAMRVTRMRGLILCEKLESNKELSGFLQNRTLGSYLKEDHGLYVCVSHGKYTDKISDLSSSKIQIGSI